MAMTLDGTLVSWNRSAERVFGYRESEIIGQHASVLAPPEERGFSAAVVRALRRGERCDNVEVKRRRRDGTLIDMVLDFSAITNPHGEIVGVAAIGRDVSAERRAEEAVRQSEARLAEAQRVARVGSWEINAATLEVTFSLEMFRLFDLDPAAGMPPHETIVSRYHPGDVDAHVAAVARTLADGTPFEMDMRIVRPGGPLRWVHLVGEAVRGETGDLRRVIGTMMDITDRVLVEERFRVLFEHSSEAHFLVAPGGIVDCNQAALHMLRCRDKAALLALHPIALSPERQPDGRLSAEKGVDMETAARAEECTASNGGTPAATAKSFRQRLC